ncbi:MAG: 5-oxoprolinase/urea amidolyase family protein [Gammaproteobacteria bacterium]|nr:5-oxoprolinase/urea amidolyase family protein [Gammaproteobacteria bacterium]
MRVLFVNRSTVLVELADLDEVLALHASLMSVPLDGIREMLPAAQTLMLRFDPARWTRQTIVEALSRRDLTTTSRAQGNLVEIPIRYDGEDLAEVAQLCGLSIKEVIRRHGASEFTVAFCGFSPGFGYLVGGDPMLQVPRRSTPRTTVPKGSVALGGLYCGVYPQASPGGWQLIGTTSMSMWDPARESPAILTPGTRVRFVDRESTRIVETTTKEKTFARPSLEVTAAALPALVQDLGRPGHAAIGVTASGALDREALQTANAVAGNPPDLAALEIAFGNFSLKCSDEVVIACAGAPTPITITRASGEIFQAAMHEAICLRSGDSVTLGYPTQGVRTYLAVRGGIDVPQTLGSSSRDVLAALGPAPVVKGSMLPIGRAAQVPTRPLVMAHAAKALQKAGDEVVLDIFVGPRADWFTEDALQVLCHQVWRVTPQSNRVGLRLHGEKTLTRQRTDELPSEGMTSGAIQVPHDGQPVLLLADHPVTGGYPVIAVVAEHHLDLAGQIPPSATIRFRVIVNPLT